LSQDSDQSNRPTAYEILAVHPAAPAELLSVAYWMTVEEIQTARESGLPLDSALHVVTRAYEKVSKPEVRAGYNLAIGHATESLATRPLPRTRLPFANGRRSHIDHYEVLGLHETAPVELVAEAYQIMRSLYLRLPVPRKRRDHLLRLLEQAHSVIGNERSRARYDERRGAERQPAPLATQRLGQRFGTALRALGRLALPPWSRKETPAQQPSMLDRLSLYLK
jgi:hypothetical protein